MSEILVKIRNAKTHVRSGDLVGALSILESALRCEQTADLWANWGTVHFALGNLNSAEYGMRSALQMDGSHLFATENLARLSIERGRLACARALLSRISTRHESIELETMRLSPQSNSSRVEAIDSVEVFGCVPGKGRENGPAHESVNAVVGRNVQPLLDLVASHPNKNGRVSGGAGNSTRNTKLMRSLDALVKLVAPMHLLAWADPAVRDWVSHSVTELRCIDWRFTPLLVSLVNLPAPAAEETSGWFTVSHLQWLESVARMSAGDLVVLGPGAGFDTDSLLRAVAQLSAGIWVWIDLDAFRRDGEALLKLRSRLSGNDHQSLHVLAGCLQPALTCRSSAPPVRVTAHNHSPDCSGNLAVTPDAVFIHAMWRTGSTYIWNKFRERSIYRTYYEPFHESLLTISAEERDKGLVPKRDAPYKLRHPAFERPYFSEYPVQSSGGVPELKAPLCYRRYCLDPESDDVDLTRYLQRLMLEAGYCRQVPVFQFNRSLLRTGWIRRRFAGRHLLLLRDPREVWNSFQTQSSYFAGAICQIIGQNRHHRWIRPLATRWSIPFVEGENLGKDFAFYRAFAERLGEDGYPIFHAFYLLTCIYNLTHVDVMIDINVISLSSEMRQRVETQLRENNIDISMSDCAAPSYSDPRTGQWEAAERENLSLLHEYLFLEMKAPRAVYALSLETISPVFRTAFEPFLTG